MEQKAEPTILGDSLHGTKGVADRLGGFFAWSGTRPSFGCCTWSRSEATPTRGFGGRSPPRLRGGAGGGGEINSYYNHFTFTTTKPLPTTTTLSTQNDSYYNQASRFSIKFFWNYLPAPFPGLPPYYNQGNPPKPCGLPFIIV